MTPQSVLYWQHNNFSLGYNLYLNSNPEPAHFEDNSFEQQLDRITNTVQAFGVHTIYVDSENDFVFLDYIKQQLKNQYSYTYELKMEVKS